MRRAGAQGAGDKLSFALRVGQANNSRSHHPRKAGSWRESGAKLLGAPRGQSGKRIFAASDSRPFRPQSTAEAPNNSPQTEAGDANPRKCRRSVEARKSPTLPSTSWWRTQSHETGLRRSQSLPNRERTGIFPQKRSSGVRSCANSSRWINGLSRKFPVRWSREFNPVEQGSAPIQRRINHSAVAALLISFRPALLAGVSRVRTDPALLETVRDETILRGRRAFESLCEPLEWTPKLQGLTFLLKSCRLCENSERFHVALFRSLFRVADKAPKWPATSGVADVKPT
jgi:hypothetical protein